MNIIALPMKFSQRRLCIHSRKWYDQCQCPFAKHYKQISIYNCINFSTISIVSTVSVASIFNVVSTVSIVSIVNIVSTVSTVSIVSIVSIVSTVSVVSIVGKVSIVSIVNNYS